MVSPYFKRHRDFNPKIGISPHKDLGISVVIPSYNEPDLYKSLQALKECKRPKCAVEVIVVINFPEGASPDIVKNAEECVALVGSLDKFIDKTDFKLFSIRAFNLPKKHAGVGLARKIGMDEAAWRLSQQKNDYGIIACFDADATCSENYLLEIEKLWQDNPSTEACSIRYEHPIRGTDYSEKTYEGITQYELHLRYYMWAGRYVGHPHSHQTVGSSMACSAEAYLRYGGMNKNKAGEDFYFLQKIIPSGNFRELNTTTVFPSPRASHRVPFGTGRAMTKYLESDNSQYLTYNLSSFLPLKPFLANSSNLLFGANRQKTNILLKEQPSALREYLEGVNFIDAIEEINNNTSNSDSFAKRYFHWFDAFKLLKYLNYANEKHYQRKPVKEEAIKLAKCLKLAPMQNSINTKELLSYYRDLDLLPNNYFKVVQVNPD